MFVFISFFISPEYKNQAINFIEKRNFLLFSFISSFAYSTLSSHVNGFYTNVYYLVVILLF